MSESIVPEEFSKVVKDFINDLQRTFKEYEPFISKWWKNEDSFNHIVDKTERNATYLKSQETSIQLLFKFCQKKLPPRFFDILYQNEDMFKEESDIDTEFFPKIHFKNLWQSDISENTKATLWKYLQLIMFSIIGTLDNKDAFGDSAKMFEAINKDEFKTKLEETFSHMQGFFDTSGNEDTEPANLPDANKIHEHITGMLNGKLGQLAKEIAEESAANLNIDFDNATDMKDIFQKLISNPTKLMGLVKTVGDKLDSRLKSGELKESELLSEATDLMNKMKHMPGMENIQSMLSKMGMNAAGNSNVNTAAMEANLAQKMKLAKTKERIKAKSQANAKAKIEKQLHEELQKMQQPVEPAISEEELIKIFSSGEHVERTPRKQNNKKKGKTTISTF